MPLVDTGEDFPLLDRVLPIRGTDLSLVRYEDFVQKLRRFQRTSLLAQATNGGWIGWDTSERFEKQTKGHQDASLFRAYAGRIAALGAAEANDFRSSLTKPDDLRTLIHQFAGIRDPISERRFRESQTQELMSRLSDVPAPLNRLAEPPAAQHAAAVLSFCRTFRSQWEARTVRTEGLVRAWWLLTWLEAKYSLFDRLSSCLQIHPRDHLRAGFLLMAAAMRRDGSPGRINLADSRVQEELQGLLNLDADALRQVANRFSRSCSDFRDWHNGVRRRVPEELRAF